MERARTVVDAARGGRPRTLVLAECWASAGVDAPALCNKAGQPVARAVKCLIDPLIIRPRLRPHLAAPLLDDAAAAELADLLAGNRERLACASGWFLQLRSARRRRRITEGNAQELYFPRAHELAVMLGDPGALTSEEVAAECDQVLSEVHCEEVTAADVRAYLDAPGVAGAIADELAEGWAAERGAVVAGPDAAVLADELWMLLDEPEAADASWDALVESGECAVMGAAVRARGGVVAELLAAFESPEQDVMLSASDPVAPPAVIEEAARSAAEVQAVLDKTVEARCRSALRRLREHGGAVGAGFGGPGTAGTAGTPGTADGGVAAFVAGEVARAAEPFGVSAAGAQTAFAAGIAVAAGLQPLNRGLPEGPLLIRELQARLRKEAYVMHLRRLLVGGCAIDARQQRVVDQLGAFDAPYLNRLWPRLHGLDVLGQGPIGADGARELLSGVARSVVYDHRQLIRTALEAA